MDDRTEANLQEVLAKAGLSTEDVAFLDQASRPYSNRLQAALARDYPGLEFIGCRIRGLHPDRLVFAVWCQISGRHVQPPPCYLYTLNRTTGVAQTSSTSDQERYSLKLRR